MTTDQHSKRCIGRNHSDYSTPTSCPGCGRSVQRDSRGRLHDVSERFACYGAEHSHTVWEAARHTVASATQVSVGSTVTVVKGRKLPKGLTGEVTWMGDKGYGMSVRIKHAGGADFTAVTNVEPVVDAKVLAEAQAMVDAQQVACDAFTVVQASLRASQEAYEAASNAVMDAVDAGAEVSQDLRVARAAAYLAYQGQVEAMATAKAALAEVGLDARYW